MAFETEVYDHRGDLTIILQKKPTRSQELRNSFRNAASDLPPTAEAKVDEIYMQVSSTRLKSVSEVFGELVSKENRTVIRLPDNCLAFTILMNIVHDRPRLVPTTTTLEFAVELAILVDKYQLTDIISPFSDMWIQSIKKSLKQSLSEDLVLWLCVAWVFKKADEFAVTTHMLLFEGDGSEFSDVALMERLPISAKVIKKIQHDRMIAIRDTYRVIKNIVTKYQTKQYICTGTGRFNGNPRPIQLARMRLLCDGNVLGQIIKQAIMAGVWPIPTAPFVGRSFAGVRNAVARMGIVSTCVSSCVSIQATKAGIREMLDVVEGGLRGVELGFFDEPKKVGMEIEVEVGGDAAAKSGV